MLKSLKAKNIRLALMVWGFFVILAGLAVEAALIIPQIEDTRVQGSRAECPGQWAGNLDGIADDSNGFWGYHKCEGQTEWAPCNRQDAVYSDQKPTFDPNFCGMQQIDFTETDSEGNLIFESCLITECGTTPPPPPPPGNPACGSPCTTNEDCSDLGNNPVCLASGCYDAAACDGTNPPPPPPPPVCPNKPRVQVSVNGSEFSGNSPVVLNDRNQTITVRVRSNDMKYMFTASNNNDQVGMVCSDPAGRLDPNHPLCAETFELNFSNSFWDNSEPRLRVDAFDNGEIINDCGDQIRVRFGVSNENPGYEIIKEVMDSDNIYNIGETVNFRVTFRNTGETTLDVIPFRDLYNPSRLDFLSANGNKNGAANTNISYSINEATGLITHTDLSTVLGNLAPGEYYQLNFAFRALSRVSRTCNEAFINPDDMGEEMDDACIVINTVVVGPPDL